jgi:hypothetical protein
MSPNSHPTGRLESPAPVSNQCWTRDLVGEFVTCETTCNGRADLGGSVKTALALEQKDIDKRIARLPDAIAVAGHVPSLVGKGWRPQRDSNPCFGLERATSWASGRWGRTEERGRLKPRMIARESGLAGWLTGGAAVGDSFESRDESIGSPPPASRIEAQCLAFRVPRTVWIIQQECAPPYGQSSALVEACESTSRNNAQPRG